ncbi:MAG: fibronectin type III domain-containing protein, partial [Candidatus Aenigmarchaeota archaeon]|nr:fibronectin type III domain-containing protein [Candidatus Aenigmarchaeota archaeon]
MKNFLLVLFFAAVITPFSVQAELSCSVKTSCSGGETDFFHMSGLSNAHAELASQTAYGYKVCCGGAKGGLTTECLGNAEILLKLSGVTNAHAEKGTFSNYQYQVCLNANEGLVNCGYANSPSACTALGTGYRCLAAISSESNAHVSDCDGTNDYDIKLCCEYKDVTPPVTAINPDGSSWTGQDVPFSLSCSDFGGYCQSTYYKIVNGTESCGSAGFFTGTSGAVTCPAGSGCTKKLCYYSIDDSGNSESAKTSNVFRLDKQPPVTTDDSDDNWHGNDVGITLTCQDSLAGCAGTNYCTYDEGGVPCNPATSGNTVTLSCSGTCRKIIRYYSRDTLNNQESPHNSRTIKIDTTIPSCTIAPLGEYSKSASFRISWSATSPPGSSPISNVTIEKNETGLWEFLSVSQQTSGYLDFTAQNGRTYYFRCFATNAKGPGGYSVAVRTTVDTQPPSQVS